MATRSSRSPEKEAEVAALYYILAWFKYGKGSLFVDGTATNLGLKRGVEDSCATLLAIRAAKREEAKRKRGVQVWNIAKD